MNIDYRNGKVYSKTIFSEKEILASDIDRVIVENYNITFYLKSGKKLFSKQSYPFLFENLNYFIRNNIFFEDKDLTEKAYSAVQVQDMYLNFKEKVKCQLGKSVKKILGEEYDCVLEIVGEEYYSYALIRLSKDGDIIFKHPLYTEFDEEKEEWALASEDLSFLSLWDSNFREGKYYVSEIMRDSFKMDEYLKDIEKEIKEFVLLEEMK